MSTTRSLGSHTSEESEVHRPSCKIPQRALIAFYVFFILTYARLSTNLIFNLNSLVIIKKEALEVNKTLHDKTKKHTVKTLQEKIGVICKDSHKKSYFLDIASDIPENMFHADYDSWGSTYGSEIECANYVALGVGCICFAFLTNRTGIKHFITVSMFLVSVSNFILPLIIDSSSGNISVTLMAYVIYGLLESPFIIFCTYILSHWVPRREITFTCGLSFTGYFLGPVFGTALLSKLFLLSTNWKNIFYAFGGIGMAVALAWHFLAHESPQHAKVKLGSDEELYLRREMYSTLQFGRKRFPMKKILLTSSVWGMIFGTFAPIWSDTMGWIVFGEMLEAIDAVSLVHDTKWTLIKVFATFFNTAVFGFLTDWLVNKEYLSLITLRQFFTVICSLGPTVFLLSVSYIFCHKQVVTTKFAIASFLQSFFGLGVRLLPLDVSPNFSAMLMGLTKGLSSFATLGIQLLYKKLTPSNTLSEFQQFLWYMLAVMFVSTLLFVLMADTKIASWNEVVETQQRTKRGRKKSVFASRLP